MANVLPLTLVFSFLCILMWIFDLFFLWLIGSPSYADEWLIEDQMDGGSRDSNGAISVPV